MSDDEPDQSMEITSIDTEPPKEKSRTWHEIAGGLPGARMNVAFRPERVNIAWTGKARVDCPETATDDDGTIVPCAFDKDHDGRHRFIVFGGVEHRCGLCGETFEIKPTDPHWVTGRGPICPPKPKLRSVP